MTPLLDATDLALPGRLEATSLRMERPELICLVGPNGSGKTSLLHALAAIGSPSGDVRIAGVNPLPLAPAQRMRLLSYLPATRDIPWPLTARDLIALGAPEAEDFEEIVEALGLQEFLARRLDRLSTGERSRVLIARALAARPKLLLLDEPIANLDPYWQLKLMDWLRAVPWERGQAVLLALHDLDVAARYADRLILMEDGRIVADGEPAAIIEGPQIPAVFGIARENGLWRPLSLAEDRRSSP